MMALYTVIVVVAIICSISVEMVERLNMVLDDRVREN